MGQYHAEHVKITEGLSVKGVYDINPGKNAVAEKRDLIAYPSYEEMLSDRGIDTIIVATPNNFHKANSIDALRAGKHVLCEKPVMMSVAELEEVLAVAAASGKLFSAHQNRRWDEDFNIVKRAIADGMIGKPFYVESRVQGANGVPGDWRCEEIAGGGMMLDWGVHLIDQVLMLAGSPVTEIYAHILKVKFQVDDNFKLLLKFENGLSALVEVDTYTFIPLPRWHVSGDGGTLMIEDFSNKGKIIKANRLRDHYEPGIVYTASGPTKTMAPRPVESVETLPLPEVKTSWLDYYRNFAAAARGETEPFVTHAQMNRLMRVIEAAFESSAEGKTVRCRL
jgi:predicted dehydrogenase